MRTALVLPVAPRPFEDELLSAWQERVACLYARTAADLESWVWTDSAQDRTYGFLRRDFSPDDHVIEGWAQMCRLPGERLWEMTLSRYTRPLAWYVIKPSHRGVCPACLDEDAACGQDHYVRRTWAHVEAVTCFRHGRSLRTYCHRCFGRAGLEFRERAGKARLVCVACLTVAASARVVQATERPTFVEKIATSMTASVDGEAIDGLLATDILKAARLLWRPVEARGRPFIACTGLALPTERQGQPEAAAPLATASLEWRVVTLIAVAQLLDLGSARNHLGPPSALLWRAWEAEREKADAARLSAQPPAQPPKVNERTFGQFVLRSDEEYRIIAGAMLAELELRLLQNMGKAARRRQLGRLMVQALNQMVGDRTAGPTIKGSPSTQLETRVYRSEGQATLKNADPVANLRIF